MSRLSCEVMSRHPIHDVLEKLWEELFAADRYDMREVLLDRAEQKALHDEMRGDFGIEQRYHFDRDVGRFVWRGLPIITQEQRKHVGARFNGVDDAPIGISWTYTPEFVQAAGQRRA